MSRRSALCLVLLLACGGPPPAASDPPAPGAAADGAVPPVALPAPVPGAPPDMLVVLFGGLRAPGPLPPAVEGLPEEADLGAILAGRAFQQRPPALHFRAAYGQSVVPWLSLGSALTGRYVSSLPLCSVPERLEGPAPFCAALPAWAPTLGEVLGLYGYRTGLVAIDDPGLAALARGFETVVAPADADPDQAWSGVEAGVAAARAFWEDPDPRPKLLVVVGALNDAGFRDRERRRAAEAPVSAAERAAQLAAQPLLATRVPAGRAHPLASPAVAATGRRFYAAGLGYVGDTLAPLLAAADDEDLVLLGGLYGLSLGAIGGAHTPEQLRVGTSQVLLDRTLRTSLWLRGPLPPGLPETVEAPVELIDLVPTLVALGGGVQPAALPGRDLFAAARLPDPQRPAYAEYGDMLALRKGRHFAVFRPQHHGVTSASPVITEVLEGALPPGAWGPEHGDRGRTEDLAHFWRLHDVVADPLQDQDLALGLHAGPFPAVAQALWAHRTGPAAPPVAQLSFEQIQDLRRDGALHYW